MEKLEKLDILIADDNVAVANMMKKFIESNSKFKILDIATSSKEQLEMMEKYSPHVILTDIMRKGEEISGLDIILKAEEENRKEKFILVTASHKREYFRNDEEIPKNIIGYLRKPFEWNELIIQLERAEMVVANCTGGLNQNYYILPIINLDEELTAEEKSILKKLDIEIKAREYTHSEFDIIKQKLLFYYNEEEDIEEQKQYKIALESKGVTLDEYKKILDKYEGLEEIYIHNKIN